MENVDSVNNNKYILVVDDEEMLRDVLKEVLNMVGLSAMFASSGSEGLEMFRQNQDKIHLVLLDVLMPDMGGVETYRAITKIDMNMKFIFMSGFPDNEALAIRELTGNFAFIKKPFSVQDIISAIKKMIE
jgi:two-component system cell cycle sensor histidine kinase/response regulator CckA